MKSDFMNWAVALFAVGVLVTGGVQLLDLQSSETKVAATHSAGIVGSSAN